MDLEYLRDKEGIHIFNENDAQIKREANVGIFKKSKCEKCGSDGWVKLNVFECFKCDREKIDLRNLYENCLADLMQFNTLKWQLNRKFKVIKDKLVKNSELRNDDYEKLLKTIKKFIEISDVTEI